MSKYLVSLADASDMVLECRVLGHAWQHVHDPRIVTGRGGRIIEITRDTRCMRCDSTRSQRIDIPTMTILSTTMHYTPGYLMAKGLPPVRRYDARREEYERHFGPLK